MSRFVGAVCLTTIAGVLLLARPADAATTYFVRQSGVDTADGLSPAMAFASVRKGAAMLRAPGDTLVVGPGVYQEGNIGILFSGTRDRPIRIEADTSGVRTGDEAADVVIQPPNTPDATTGFLLFGARDVVIVNFVIEGAADAGIQVRPNYSTDADATRITLEANSIRGGAGHGIDVRAVGDVRVHQNRIVDQAGTCISVHGGNEGPVRADLRDNQAEGCARGIHIENARDSALTSNVVHARKRDIQIIDSERIALIGNIASGSREFSLDAAPVTGLRLVGNELGPTRIVADGSVEIVDCRLVEQQGPGFSHLFSLWLDQSAGDFLIEGSTLELAELTTRGSVTLRDNDSSAFVVKAHGDIEVTDHLQRTYFQLLGSARTVVEGNVSSSIVAEGTWVEMRGNRANAITVRPFGFMVEDNIVADNLYVVSTDEHSPTSVVEEPVVGIVRGNQVGGSLWAVTSPQADGMGMTLSGNQVQAEILVQSGGVVAIHNNRSAGIVGRGSSQSTTYDIHDNISDAGGQDGIELSGAMATRIEGNQITSHQGHGVRLQRCSNALVKDNRIEGNGTGGVRANPAGSPTGDCNADGQVTVDEILTGIDIGLGRREIWRCRRMDDNADGEVTVDEVLEAISFALGTALPAEVGSDGGVLQVVGNRILRNGGFGVHLDFSGEGEVRDNLILDNGGVGILAQGSLGRESISVRQNLVGGSDLHGILITGSDGASARDNRVFSNGQSGIILRDAEGGVLSNNLVYANGEAAIGIGRDSDLATNGALVRGNTLYANEGWGITLGSELAPALATEISDNIIAANARGGIAAETGLGSLSELSIHFNLNLDGYGHGVHPSVTDFQADPDWVLPAGDDGILGGSGWEDDDFRLQPESAAIDAGSEIAPALGVIGSAVAGFDTDIGIVDLGFHVIAEIPE